MRFNDRPKSGEVYLPGEEPPPDGRQPFFAPGGVVTLIVLVISFALIFWLKSSGYMNDLHNWVKAALFGR